jgi:two-component system LytT family response regulator
MSRAPAAMPNPPLARFARISHAAIVNLDRVKALMTDEKGDTTVLLADGPRLPYTRGVRELQARLELA